MPRRQKRRGIEIVCSVQRSTNDSAAGAFTAGSFAFAFSGFAAARALTAAGCLRGFLAARRLLFASSRVAATAPSRHAERRGCHRNERLFESRVHVLTSNRFFRRIAGNRRGFESSHVY